MHFKTQEERQNAAQSEINTLQAAVAVFPAVRNVLQSFDGKVYNKRLQTALQKATGKSIYCEHRYNIIDIYIIVKSGSYNRRTLAVLKIEDMKDGKRINAEKAIESAAEYRTRYLKSAAHIQIEVLRLPHPDVCEYFHYGSFRPPDPTFPIMAFNEVYHYIRFHTDTWWIAGGERAKDSPFRLGLINTAGSIDDKRGRFYPLAQWDKSEVLAYIKKHKLYLGADSRVLGSSFYGLHGKCLIEIKKHFPEDYEKLLHLYPLAEAGVKREEERLARGDNYYSKKY